MSRYNKRAITFQQAEDFLREEVEYYKEWDDEGLEDLIHRLWRGKLTEWITLDSGVIRLIEGKWYLCEW